MKFKLNIIFISLLIIELLTSSVSASDVNSDGTFTDLQNIINNDITRLILDRNYLFSIC